MVIITILMLVALVYICRIFYQIWTDDQKEKKRHRERQSKRPKAFRKAEYDCTENFYHD